LPVHFCLFVFGILEFELGALCLQAGALPLEPCPLAIFALVNFLDRVPQFIQASLDHNSLTYGP
jgi:hypothetical protein